MTGEFFAFFILAICAIGGAVFMIHFDRVMHMALSLAFTFFAIAGLFFLLDAEFVAVIQILIYAGAVSILMLFGIMLTKHQEKEQTFTRTKLHQWLSFLFALGFLAILMSVIYLAPFTLPAGDQSLYSVNKLAEQLFKSGYVLPFELTSLLLLVALIGSIILAKKEEKE
ncbi:NADH dehydrogenase subunit J [Seinonella peptonophila]|uniref:NADH-quinone oxidoreductase subunit J n=1 Tax=Seinonella peptonophila TaxID=112248 RepID=A0A1M4XT30_9BACL|nr:NADH-quinone oxidoreductase subunit J [Seinonella peptonophila]SHE96649.1 NADH dehydrogenase subunit J [Seinonella peptonophila]